MKKLIVFIFIILIMCLTKFSFTKNLSLADIFGGANIEVYAQEEILNMKNVKNGDGYIVYCNVYDLDYIYNNYKINGFTVNVKNVSINKILDLLGACKIEKNDYGFYGVSDVLMWSYNLKCGDKNLQIIESDGGVMVGCPILLGSY